MPVTTQKPFFKGLLLLLLIQGANYKNGNCQVISDPSPQQYNTARFSNKAIRLLDGLNKNLDKKTVKFLAVCEKNERKLLKKLSNTKDSVLAKSKLSSLSKEYDSIRKTIKDSLINYPMTYNPQLDSIRIALKTFSNDSGAQKALTLRNNFNSSELIKRTIKNRRENIETHFASSDRYKALLKLNKSAFYYQQQLLEYSALLKNKKVLINKVLSNLKDSKIFQELFQKNSWVSSLFSFPGTPEDLLTLVNQQGLQTRTTINTLVQQQVQSGGSNGMAQFKANLQDAQRSLDKIKEQALKYGASNSELEWPSGFKSNSLKTKPFFKRLELGTNIQSGKSSFGLPANSDLGLSVGYKLNDKSVIGIGAAYRVGWGNGWQNIKISNEGSAFRSFLDWKIRKSFYITGAFELNFFNGSTGSPQSDYNKKSGLIGISKQLSLNSKIFKKTKVQLFWDFLSDKRIPRSKSIIFRMGYNLK